MKTWLLVVILTINVFCFESLTGRERDNFKKQYNAYVKEFKNGNYEVVAKYCQGTLDSFGVIQIDPDSKKLRSSYNNLTDICTECHRRLERGQIDLVSETPVVNLQDTQDITLDFARLSVGLNIDSINAFAARYPGWYEDDILSLLKKAHNRIYTRLMGSENWDEIIKWRGKVAFPLLIMEKYKKYLLSDFSLKKMVLFGEIFDKDPLTIKEISNRYEQYLYDLILAGDSESGQEYMTRYPDGRFAADIKARLWQRNFQ